MRVLIAALEGRQVGLVLLDQPVCAESAAAPTAATVVAVPAATNDTEPVGRPVVVRVAGRHLTGSKACSLEQSSRPFHCYLVQ